MRLLTKIAISAVLLLASTAAAQDAPATQMPPPPPPAAKPIDPGRLEGGKYVNDFFGISLSLPQNWVVHGETVKNAIMKTSREVVEAEANARTKAELESSLARSTFLFIITKYGPGQQNVAFNAYASLGVERVPTAIVKTGSDYFDQMRSLMHLSAMKVEQQGPVRSANYGGVKFYVIDLKVTLQQGEKGVAAERLYATVMRGYALVFTFGYLDEDDLKTFDGIMNSVKFK
jgi:hypothetical protein